MAMTEPKPMIRLDAPAPQPCDDAERKRKALEQLRRNLKSAVKQVESLLEIEEQKERAA